MKINYVRSSSINQWDFCNFSYFLEYVLGMETLSGKAALKGTIVHQVLEWMGLLKIKNKTHHDPISLLEKAWEYHTVRNKRIELNRFKKRGNGETADYKFCINCINTVIDTMFNPYKLNVLSCEKRFKIPIPGKEWNHNNKQFEIRGTIDMIHELNKDTIEIVDWKTGKRKNWATSKDKDFYDLMTDIQPRMYHLAASILYPQYKNIIATFYYINDGGPVTLPFSSDDINKTLSYLWSFYKKVRKYKTLKRNLTWKCDKFCTFGRNGICNRIWNEIEDNQENIEEIEKQYYRLTLQQQDKIMDF